MSRLLRRYSSLYLWYACLRGQKNLSLTQEEYLRAYYAAILESQQKASQAAAATAAAPEPNIAAQNPSVETVAEGSAMTVKKEYGEDDDDVEWEDAPAAGIYADMPSVPFWKTRESWICMLLIQPVQVSPSTIRGLGVIVLSLF